MDQPKPTEQAKQKDDKKPAIPTLRESTQKPQLKIKGLQSGQSLIQRLKQFKKKDMAFILAGLGVLFMAPLAEHFLMSPEGGDSGVFQQGWGYKPGQGGIGQGGSPFEPGAGGVAPGDLAGGGSDVITPLNVRDPSALIMGPNSQAQAPAVASNGAAAPAKEENNWKDALSQSAAHAAGAAASRAGLPIPKVPLTSGGLRGLGAVQGGGGANFSLPAISANGVPNRGGGGGSLGLAKAAPGYAGAASKTSAGSLEALKAAAAKAGSDFNRAGGAGSALEQAASRNMGSGNDASNGAGQGGSGLGADKAGGQSSSKDSKSEGESLAFLAAKMNQEKAIDLKWKLIEKKAMLWPDLKQKMLEEMVMSPLKKFTEGISDMVAGGEAAAFIACVDDSGGGKLIKKGDVAKNGSDPKQGEAKPYYWAREDMICIRGSNCSGPGNVFTHCSDKGKGDGKPDPNGRSAVTNTGAGVGGFVGDNLSSLCDTIRSGLDAQNQDKAGLRAVKNQSVIDAYSAQARAIASILGANSALSDGPTILDCAGSQVPRISVGTENSTIVRMLYQSGDKLATDQKGSVLTLMFNATTVVKDATGPLLKKADVPKESADPGTTGKTLAEVDTPLAQNLGKFATSLQAYLNAPAEQQAALKQGVDGDKKAALDSLGDAQPPVTVAQKYYTNYDAQEAPLREPSGIKTTLASVSAALNAMSPSDQGALAKVEVQLNQALDKSGNPAGYAPPSGQGIDPGAFAKSNQLIKANWDAVNKVRIAAKDFWGAQNTALQYVQGGGQGGGQGGLDVVQGLIQKSDQTLAKPEGTAASKLLSGEVSAVNAITPMGQPSVYQQGDMSTLNDRKTALGDKDQGLISNFEKGVNDVNPVANTQSTLIANHLKSVGFGRNEVDDSMRMKGTGTGR